MASSTLNVLGATNLAKSNREPDNWYATDEIAVDKLLEREKEYFIGKDILEPCCGSRNISDRLQDLLKDDLKSITNIDIVERGYEDIVGNYLNLDCKDKYGVIVTNPPYDRKNTHVNIILKAIEDVKEGGTVYMFLKTLFLESQSRYDKLFSIYPPEKVYIFSSRIACYKCNDRTNVDKAVSYAWFKWTKGFTGKTELEWIR